MGVLGETRAKNSPFSPVRGLLLVLKTILDITLAFSATVGPRPHPACLSCVCIVLCEGYLSGTRY
jgi:hypothetical protein